MSSICLAYRSSWNDELPPARVDFKPLTHIAHSFAAIKNGKVEFPDRDASRLLIDTAHKNKVKVVLAVGGASSNPELTALCATDDGANRLAAEIADGVKTLGYDGVDIDWEFPENAVDSGRMTRFVIAMRKALPRGKTLSMATSSVDWYGRWFDAKSIVPQVDWLSVMCYDFYGPWSERAGYHSALFPSKTATPGREDAILTASGAIRYWRETKAVPADKLLLGIPLYARGFRTDTWGKLLVNPADKNREVAYQKLYSVARKSMQVDPDAVTAIWRDENDTVLYSGDNAETARKKGAWAKRERLGGIFFWELSQDGDDRAVPSLIRAARTGYDTGK